MIYITSIFHAQINGVLYISSVLAVMYSMHMIAGDGVRDRMHPIMLA